jgi:putative MFS transporter
MSAVFEPRYRSRALRALAVVVLVYAAEFATRTWLFYHPVRTLGIEPGIATCVLVACGGLGLLGFPLGGRCADLFGRRATFTAAASAFAISAVGYYWVTLHAGAWSLAVLALSLFGTAVGGNAALVAFRALTSELFPTHLRGTVGGWLAVGGAVGWLAAMLAISALAGPLGGLAPAVALLVATSLPTASFLLLRLPETAGLDLDSASLERTARAT